jgi:Amt family ammonium transporter
MTAFPLLSEIVWIILCTGNLAASGVILYFVMRHLRSGAASSMLAGMGPSEGSTAALLDLLHEMEQQRLTGDFTRPLSVAADGYVGQIAAQYNRVLQRASDEIRSREELMVAVRTAEEKYRSIFENAIGGIFQTTPDGQYLSANPTLARIYGYANVGEMIRGIRDIQHQLYVDPQRRQDFREQIQATGVVRNFESQVFRVDGSVIWISENARVIRDETGVVQYYEGTVEDISERKQDEALLLQAAAALARLKGKSAEIANQPNPAEQVAAV